jgi:hypothetical protein
MRSSAPLTRVWVAQASSARSSSIVGSRPRARAKARDRQQLVLARVVRRWLAAGLAPHRADSWPSGASRAPPVGTIGACESIAGRSVELDTGPVSGPGRRPRIGENDKSTARPM